METQLIIGKNNFLRNKIFSSDEGYNNHIIDYFDISTMFLRTLHIFSYRIQHSKYPLIGKEKPSELIAFIKQYAQQKTCSNSVVSQSLCFDLDLKCSVFCLEHMRNIEKNISSYIGVLYDNY
ncbi:hypothetical protein [Pelotomaculum sp. PtaB.Bin117]|uniref:hypothetical protein n=1 Tax=Pelotomaculum sp. PtaB.Bin117 TaxID=1811694 RepID=UPI0009D3C632|nr:hypothetical protein [Pelotomaculum sp. PtaB.Bin117]OPX88158.1 MAG: hypothetical protein A4E54_01382 [Pelotomaculum sp. PtaB.Bin117]